MKLIRLLVGSLVSICFVVYLTHTININLTWRYISSTNFLLIGIAGIIHLMSFFFRASRYSRFVKPSGAHYDFTLFSIVSISFFMNNVLPFRLGDFYRPRLANLDEPQVGYWAGALGVLIEKLLDALLLAFILLLCSLITPMSSVISHFKFFAIILCVSVIPIGYFYLRFYPLILGKLVDAPFIGKVASTMLTATKYVMESLDRVGSVMSMIDTIFIWALEWFACWLVLLSFHIDPSRSLTISLVVLSVINMGIMIPSSPGYIGTLEWFAILALGAFSVNRSLGLSIAISLHFVQFVPITLVGFISALTRMVKNKPLLVQQKNEPEVPSI